MVPQQNYNYQRIEQAIIFLEKNFKRQPDLNEIADHVNLSPFHFQRIFTEWAGISPKRFLQYLTVGYLKDKLSETKNLEEAAADAGLSAQSRVYDLFTTLEAMTPQEYKLHGAGIVISYGIHRTLFGDVLIGITGRGVCWLSFLPEGGEFASIEEMKRYWYCSAFQENKAATKAIADKIFNNAHSQNRFNLLVKGTNFQVKVWEALLNIPSGHVTSYQDIASKIGHKTALQAVGSAVGSNHIAYLIPCHRVIRKDGLLGEYRWNSARKKGLIGWEMGRRDAAVLSNS